VWLPVALLVFSLMSFGSQGTGQDSALTNGRIVEMTKLKVGDDVIIAKIQASKCAFQLADSDLVELTNAGISSKVIAAMIEANTITIARVFVDAASVELRELEVDPPDTSFLRGSHASIVGRPSLELVLELPRGGRVENYMLVKLEVKSNRRVMPRKPKYSPMHTVPLDHHRFKVVSESAWKPGEYLVVAIGSFDLARAVYVRGYDFSVQ
jgi:hypothetical protein